MCLVRIGFGLLAGNGTTVVSPPAAVHEKPGFGAKNCHLSAHWPPSLAPLGSLARSVVQLSSFWRKDAPCNSGLPAFRGAGAPWVPPKSDPHRFGMNKDLPCRSYPCCGFREALGPSGTDRTLPRRAFGTALQRAQRLGNRGVEFQGGTL